MMVRDDDAGCKDGAPGPGDSEYYEKLEYPPEGFPCNGSGCDRQSLLICRCFFAFLSVVGEYVLGRGRGLDVIRSSCLTR